MAFDEVAGFDVIGEYDQFVADGAARCLEDYG